MIPAQKIDTMVQDARLALQPTEPSFVRQLGHHILELVRERLIENPEVENFDQGNGSHP